MVFIEMPRTKHVIAVHGLLGVAPAFIPLLPEGYLHLPMIWSLGCITHSQVMLLSVYLGMTAGKVGNKLLFVATGVAYLAIWPAMAFAEPSVASYGASYAMRLGAFAAMLLLLTLVVAGAGRILGYIQLSSLAESPRQPRTQYSLLALLVTMSVVALLIGLLRASRMADGMEGGPDYALRLLLSFALAAVVSGINIVATVWATLGVGSVRRRLVIVAAIAPILVLLVGVSALHEIEPWWLLAARSLLASVTVAVIALTLLHFRSLGFRLVRTRAAAERLDQVERRAAIQSMKS